MKKAIFLLIILILSLLVITGCKKEAPEEPQECIYREAENSI